jgi:hypothetical protein
MRVRCAAFGALSVSRIARRRRDDLVEYLLAKAPGARSEWLPFEGANRVVFSPPSPCAAADAAAAAAGPPRWWDARAG